MVDVWSDNVGQPDDVGQPDRCGRMVDRWSDSDGWSDRRTGMTDGLAVAWTDSATDLQVDRQTVGVGGMTDGLVA